MNLSHAAVRPRWSAARQRRFSTGPCRYVYEISDHFPLTDSVWKGIHQQGDETGAEDEQRVDENPYQPVASSSVHPCFKSKNPQSAIRNPQSAINSQRQPRLWLLRFRPPPVLLRSLPQRRLFLRRQAPNPLLRNLRQNCIHLPLAPFIFRQP